MQFAVGFKFQGKTGHVIVDAEDALIAALKVKMRRPEALIAMFASKISEVMPVTLCADSAARVLRTGRSKRGSVCRNSPAATQSQQGLR